MCHQHYTFIKEPAEMKTHVDQDFVEELHGVTSKHNRDYPPVDLSEKLFLIDRRSTACRISYVV